MPFKKISSGKHKGRYRSPSGKLYTAKQVRAYHTTEGFKRKARKRRKK